MKKAYTKPAIMFEDFTLSTNIAGDCEVKTNLPSNNTCGVDFSGYSVFLQGMNGCVSAQVPSDNGDGEWNNICYHIPQGGDNLFNS